MTSAEWWKITRRHQAWLEALITLLNQLDSQLDAYGDISTQNLVSERIESLSKRLEVLKLLMARHLKLRPNTNLASPDSEPRLH